jgi:hypothetical protein
MEVWKDIPDYEGGYQVSDLGRVKSLVRYRVPKDKILRAQPNRYGHTFVSLYTEGLENQLYVHKLVAEIFMGHITDGTTKKVIDHINEVQGDNRLENLQIITHKENIQKHFKLKKYESTERIK